MRRIHSGVSSRLMSSTAERHAQKVRHSETGFLYSQQPYRKPSKNSLSVKPGKNPAVRAQKITDDIGDNAHQPGHPRAVQERARSGGQKSKADFQKLADGNDDLVQHKPHSSQHRRTGKAAGAAHLACGIAQARGKAGKNLFECGKNRHQKTPFIIALPHKGGKSAIRAHFCRYALPKTRGAGRTARSSASSIV